MKIHRTYSVKESTTPDGRHSITLLDSQGNKAHESKGDTRYHALLGLVRWGFDIEWEAGETPEAEPAPPEAAIPASKPN